MVKSKTVVSLSYTLKDASGDELDRAEADEPFSYVHGVGQIVPGLEQALEGLKVGDKKVIVVEPAEGYGEIIPELRIKADRSQFPSGKEMELGMQFTADIGNGRQHNFTVMTIEGDEVSIDGNHPLAGQTLHFSVEVVGVRDATAEELAHEHVHGPGGHHH